MVQINQLSIKPFSPVAYYDKHLDCIRVKTHDRSVTEHRIDGFITLNECNRRGQFDPEYVGFTIKGVHHLFKQIGLEIEGVYKLTDLLGKIVRLRPSTTMAEASRFILSTYEKDDSLNELEVRMSDAA